MPRVFCFGALGPAVCGGRTLPPYFCERSGNHRIAYCREKKACPSKHKIRNRVGVEVVVIVVVVVGEVGVGEVVVVVVDLVGAGIGDEEVAVVVVVVIRRKKELVCSR